MKNKSLLILSVVLMLFSFRVSSVFAAPINNHRIVSVAYPIQAGLTDFDEYGNYTGYTYEAIIQNPTYLKILELCNVLVDGEFKIEEKDLRLQFRGSKNQRIIDVQKSINDNRTVLWNKKG